MTYKPNHPLFLLAYQFDTQTMRYINVVLAHINPAESLGAEAKYFLDDNATYEPVPHVAPDGKDWYRKGGQDGEWLLVDLNDNKTWYDKATGQQVPAPAFGDDVPDTITNIAPESRDGFVVSGFDGKSSSWIYRKDWTGTVVYSVSDQAERVLTVDDVDIPDGFTTLTPDSSAFDWDAKNKKWVLNVERQAAIDTQAQQQAVIKAVSDVKQALQTHIDNVATGLGFSAGNALMLYAGFKNPFTHLAQAFGVWEAGVWVAADAYMAQVQAGTAPLLTPEQAVAHIPAFTPPESAAGV